MLKLITMLTLKFREATGVNDYVHLHVAELLFPRYELFVEENTSNIVKFIAYLADHADKIFGIDTKKIDFNCEQKVLKSMIPDQSLESKYDQEEIHLMKRCNDEM